MARRRKPVTADQEADLSTPTRMLIRRLIREVSRIGPVDRAKSSSQGRHYAPDALRDHGRRRLHRLLIAPTYLALREACSAGHLHVVYRAGTDRVGGNCYDPELLQGVRKAFRATLQVSSRRGHAAMLAVQTGIGKRPLHLHVLCPVGTPLPEEVVVGPADDPLAVFRQPTSKGAKPFQDDIQYLLRPGHKGSGKFNPTKPYQVEDQHEDFRTALKLWKEGKARTARLGLSRAPARIFTVWTPRLTDRQKAAVAEIVRQTWSGTVTVTRITSNEWKHVEHLFHSGANTPRAQERKRAVLNYVLAQRQSTVSPEQVQPARQDGPEGIARSTYYELKKKVTPLLEQACTIIAGIRQMPARVRALLRRLKKRSR